MITNTRLICTISLKAVEIEVILYEVILYVTLCELCEFSSQHKVSLKPFSKS